MLIAKAIPTPQIRARHGIDSIQCIQKAHLSRKPSIQTRIEGFRASILCLARKDLPA